MARQRHLRESAGEEKDFGLWVTVHVSERKVQSRSADWPGPRVLAAEPWSEEIDCFRFLPLTPSQEDCVALTSNTAGT